MKHGDKFTSREDMNKYFKEVEDFIKEGKKNEAFDRLVDLQYWLNMDDYSSYGTKMVLEGVLEYTEVQEAQSRLQDLIAELR